MRLRFFYHDVVIVLIAVVLVIAGCVPRNVQPAQPTGEPTPLPSVEPAETQEPQHTPAAGAQDEPVQPGLPAPTYADLLTGFMGTGDDYLTDVVELPDGLALAGGTESFGGGGADFWLMRLDSAGQVLWQRSYGGPADDSATALAVMDDGFLLAGSTVSYGAGGLDVWVVRTDESGNVVWQYAYGGVGDEDAFAMRAAPDGGALVAGYTTSTGSGGQEAWLLRLNPDGSVKWQKNFGGAEGERLYGVAAGDDGSWYISGVMILPDVTQTLVARLDDDGNPVWVRSLGDGLILSSSSIETAPDGMILGGSVSNGDDHDLWAALLDEDGRVIWQQAYGGGGDDYAEAIKPANDGGWYLLGESESVGLGGREAWVLHLDPSGGILWQRSFGGEADDYADLLLPQTDGVMVGGYTRSFGARELDAWLLKLDAAGESHACRSVVKTDLSAKALDVETSALENQFYNSDLPLSETSAWTQAAPLEPQRLCPALAELLPEDQSPQPTREANEPVPTGSDASAAGWISMYGMGDDLSFWSEAVVEEAGGGYSVAGFAGEDTTYDVWAAGFDPLGEIEWQYRIGSPDVSEEAADLATAADGSHLLVGKSGYDLLAVKLDRQGELLWAKIYGGDEYDRGGTAIAVDGGYLLSGFTRSFPTGGTSAWVLRLDEDGNILWQKSYGNDEYAWQPPVMVVLEDGGFLLAGELQDDGLYVLRLDAAGEPTAPAQALLLPQAGWIRKILPLTGGGFAVQGGYRDGEVDHHVLWLLDENLEPVWAREFSHDNSMMLDANGLVEAPHGLTLSGNRTPNLGTDSQRVYGPDIAFVMGVDLPGDLLWQVEYGSEEDDVYYAFQTLSAAADGGLLVGGSSMCGDGRCAFLNRLHAQGNLAACEAGVPGEFAWDEVQPGLTSTTLQVTVTDSTAQAVDADLTVSRTEAERMDLCVE